ncbi:hypothetical protein [Mycolicibacterium goodii]|uniref:hypothetical protein n=1 Tax=Mycolicibacterium goodii TaxID=134601 RepID=UPI000A4D7DDC
MTIRDRNDLSWPGTTDREVNNSVLRWFMALLVVICATACHGDGGNGPLEQPKFPNWPQSLDGLRFRWSAEPGIDLLTGPAVPLRAYLESHRTGDFTLDPQNVYPGFQRAVHPGPPNTDKFPDEPYELWYIQPFTDPRYAFGPAGKFYGNEYFHVLSLDRVDGGWRAYVCDGTYNIFREGDGPNSFVPVHRPSDGNSNQDGAAMKVWRVELTNILDPADPETPPAVNTPQEGPLPAPTDDVFGPAAHHRRKSQHDMGTVVRPGVSGATIRQTLISPGDGRSPGHVRDADASATHFLAWWMTDERPSDATATR